MGDLDYFSIPVDLGYSRYSREFIQKEAEEAWKFRDGFLKYLRSRCEQGTIEEMVEIVNTDNIPSEMIERLRKYKRIIKIFPDKIADALKERYNLDA